AACAWTARTELPRVLAASRLAVVGFGFLTMVPAHAAISLAGGRNVLPPLVLSTMGRLSGLRVRTEGRALKGALFLANHVSWLDIHALAPTSRSILVAQRGLGSPRRPAW